MSRRPVRWHHWLVYWAARAAFRVLGALPERVSFGLAAVLGSLFVRLSARRRAIALANLRQALGPGPSDAELRALARRATGNIFRVLVDLAWIERLRRGGRWHPAWDERVDFGAGARAVEDLPPGAFVFVSPHLGSWEVGLAALGRQGYRSHAIARRMDNPLLDRHLHRLREGHGLRVHPRRGGIRALAAALRRGEAAAAMLDQNQRTRGLFVPFFGRLASTDRGLPALAVRWNLPVMVVAMVRLDGGFRFRLRVEDVLRPDRSLPRPRAVEDLALRANRAMERLILAFPQQYFWVHDRYRTRPPQEAATPSAAAPSAADGPPAAGGGRRGGP